MAAEPRDPAVGSALRKASVGRTIRAVAWSFIGLRKGSEYRQDAATIQPIQVIVVGLVGALVLVLGLIALVHWVV